MKTDWVEKAHI